MKVSVYDVPSQKAALQALADLIERSTVDPIVRNAALDLTHDVDERDDAGEVYAIFNAVKNGDSRVAGLERGLKYMSDPRWADFFSSPARTLKQLAGGVNGEDCDGHAALITGLLGSIGFITGLRAWGRTKGEYDHVYAVVVLPKIPAKEVHDYSKLDWYGLDTTVAESEVGWEPPGGYALTAVMDGT